MDKEVRGVCYDRLAQYSLHPGPSLILYRVQEMEEKYRKSKAELDELVANMEGL